MNKSFPIFLFFLLTLLSVKTVKAQSLAFEQAVYLEVDLVTPPSVVPGYNPLDTVITVPAGKVWKIVSINGGTQYSNQATYYPAVYHQIYLDGAAIMDFDNTNDQWVSQFPIWLPAGSYDWRFACAYYSSSSSYTRTSHFLVSVLEFNVVP